MNKRGFTLIELIVVIAVIAILAGFIIARISNASVDARNARRKSDINEMMKAIQIFEANGGVTHDRSFMGSDISMSKEACDLIVNTVDRNGKSPSDYLVGGECPQDPKYYDDGIGTYVYWWDAMGMTDPYCIRTQNNPEFTYEVCK